MTPPAAINANADTATIMLLRAAEEIRAHEGLLTQLDSAIGDGDHGTTMNRAVGEVARLLREQPPGSVGDAFARAADAFLRLDCGATGPLFGTFFSGMATALTGPFDVPGFAEAVSAGILALRRYTRARPGDKTLLDALLPAAAALGEAAGVGADLATALRSAADAAWRGAEATREMVAKAGRARYQGARSVGHQDAGATSVALVFRGFAAALNQIKDEGTVHG